VKCPCALCGRATPENDRLVFAAGGHVHFGCAAKLALAHCRAGKSKALVHGGRRGKWAVPVAVEGHA